MITSDLDLLQEYTRRHSEEAFAELVKRHLNLVYSAALRQVRSHQLAEEVAQSAFTDLARNAPRLASDTILAAWLYQVARRTAIDVVRREARRQAREQIATEMNSMNATAADWTHIEFLLDEAMHALDNTDRAAVLLRYFENKTLREVGAALGTSDDTAQKRVSRAVERLREFLAKRGVTIGAGGLAAAISAHAVQAAPAGLAAAISAAAAFAGLAAHTPTVIATTKTIAMTIFSKTLIVATMAVAIGAAIYAFELRNEIGSLRQQQALLGEQMQQLQQERDDARNQLAALQQENGRLQNGQAELVKLRGEVTRLRHRQTSNPATAESGAAQTETNTQTQIELLVIAKFILFPTEDLPALGVSWKAGSGLLTSQAAKVIDEAMQGASDVTMLSAPRVSTVNGVQGQMNTYQPVLIGGSNVNVGVSFDVTANYSTNSATFDLALSAALTQLIGDPAHHDVRTITITNNATMAAGQILFLQREVPAGGWLPNVTNVVTRPQSLLVFVTPTVWDSHGLPKTP